LSVEFSIWASNKAAGESGDQAMFYKAVQGLNVFGICNLYAGRVCPSGSLDLGILNLGTGRHTQRITAVAKNRASKGFSFGIDALDLIAAK
jgi:hypothetical protein